MAPLSHAHVNLLFRFDYLPTLFRKICFLCDLTNAIYSSLKDYNSPRNIAAKSPSVWMMLSLSNPFSTAPSSSHLSTCEVLSKATRPSISWPSCMPHSTRDHAAMPASTLDGNKFLRDFCGISLCIREEHLHKATATSLSPSDPSFPFLKGTWKS